MKWITRARPKIDRIACPWPIARFIDAQAEFLFVPADDHEMLKHGMVMYDAHFAWCRHDQGKALDRPPRG